MKKLHYNAVFQQEVDQGYSVWVPNLPGCASQGDTLEEAMRNIQEAMELYLEDADEATVEEGITRRDQFMVPVQVTLP